MTTPPPQSPLQSEPGVASAEDGFVILDGPDGVAVTMTVYAACETGHSLVSAAKVAEQQQIDARGDSDV